MTTLTNRLPNRLETLDYLAKNATLEQMQTAIDALPPHSKVLAFLQPYLAAQENHKNSFSI